MNPGGGAKDSELSGYFLQASTIDDRSRWELVVRATVRRTPASANFVNTFLLLMLVHPRHSFQVASFHSVFERSLMPSHPVSTRSCTCVHNTELAGIGIVARRKLRFICRDVSADVAARPRVPQGHLIFVRRALFLVRSA
jgi:hypothetical protein